jgi:hypothetical protein
MIGTLFLISAPFMNQIYDLINPFRKNYVMGMLLTAIFLFAVWVNYSKALHVKLHKHHSYKRAGRLAGFLIFISLFQYFLLLFPLIYYFRVPDSYAPVFPGIFFGLIVFIVSVEAYVYYSKRTNFKLLINDPILATQFYAIIVALSTWIIWDVFIAAGPDQNRGNADLIVTLILSYTFTVVAIKRYYKIENLKRSLSKADRLKNAITFLFSYVTMLFSSGALK